MTESSTVACVGAAAEQCDRIGARRMPRWHRGTQQRRHDSSGEGNQSDAKIHANARSAVGERRNRFEQQLKTESRRGNGQYCARYTNQQALEQRLSYEPDP